MRAQKIYTKFAHKIAQKETNRNKKEFLMSENCIEVQNVSKSFVGRKVVDDLTLVVKKGETYGLLG